MSTRAAPLFERGYRIVPGGGAAAEDGDGFAAKRFEIDVVIGMGGKIGHQGAIDEIRPEHATGSGPAGRKNDPPRQQASTCPVFIERGPHEAACWFERLQRDAVPDRQGQHLLQPGEILDPGAIMDLVERLPGIGAVFCLVPGTEGEGGNAEGGAGQTSWASAACPCARRSAKVLPDPARERSTTAILRIAFEHQAAGGGDAVHAGADDEDIQDRLAGCILDFRRPIRCRHAQNLQIARHGPLVVCEPRHIDAVNLAQVSGPLVHGSNEAAGFLYPQRGGFCIRLLSAARWIYQGYFSSNQFPE